MRFHYQFLCDLIENEVTVPEEISQSLVSWSVASDDDSDEVSVKNNLQPLGDWSLKLDGSEKLQFQPAVKSQS